MRLWIWRLLLAALSILLVSAVAGYLLLFRPVPQPTSNDPAWVFNHGSIGNEEEQGLPFWIWRVLPAIFPDLLPGRQNGYGAIGVFWAAGDPVPIGFSVKTQGVVDLVAPNCAFCHQGSYRLAPDEPARLVSGGPGTRVDPQAYIRFLMRAGTDPRFTADRIMGEIEGIYRMPVWERLLYRYALVPLTRSALQQQAARFAWMQHRPDWGPGRIDPFNPVKFANLRLADDGTVGNSDMMPLWRLSGLAPTPERRFALHWDGLLTDLHETAVAGAIGDGMTYKSFPRARRNLARMEDFARLQQPPPSPFSPRRPAGDPYHVASASVEAGAAIYRAHCATCHEPGGPRYRTTIPIVEVGTDRSRLDMWTPAARDRYLAYEPGYDWGFRSFQKTGGYVATGHSGLWLRGPYLHNGSVPSLRDLLLPPEQRPKRFYRGSDLVNPRDGGFVSDKTELANWLYDTTVVGNGNGGHLWGTDLPLGDRENLLAFLKTL